MHMPRLFCDKTNSMRLHTRLVSKSSSSLPARHSSIRHDTPCCTSGSSETALMAARQPRLLQQQQQQHQQHTILQPRLLQQQQQHHHHHHHMQHRPRRCIIACRSVDYLASPIDVGVLKLDLSTELQPGTTTHVFGYARDLHAHYRMGEVVGVGTFGVVRLCVDIAGGERWAVKTISKKPKTGLTTPRYLLKLRNEVEIMQQLGHSLDAVTLRDVFEDDESVHLVMELCEGGVLLEQVDGHSYSESYVASVIRSVLRFISQCHAKGIIYRDVKPANFLFSSNAPDARLRATDFGQSLRHWPEEAKMTQRSGTPLFMAPEVILQSYDNKADVWSVGMMAFYLLTGHFPYWDDTRGVTLAQIWKAVLTQEIRWDAEELEHLSHQAVSFLSMLLERDPVHRPSAKQALQHSWLTERGGPGVDKPLKGSVVQRLQRFATYGRLKQLTLRMVLAQIHEDEQAGKFGSIDEETLNAFSEVYTQCDSHSGCSTLSIKHLHSGLQRQGYQLEQAEADRLFRGVDLECDLDGDCTISLPEFITTMVDWSAVQAQQHWQVHVNRVFDKLDVDGDGFIDLAELTMLLRKTCSTADAMGGGGLHEHEQEAAAKQMLREADTNCDGHISREEFYELLSEVDRQDLLSNYDPRFAPTAAS